MSRALRELRAVFDDELLVRSAGAYQLTPRAERLQRELAETLPRLQSLFSIEPFDPRDAGHTFRLASTDFLLSVIAPPLLRQALAQSPGSTFRFDGWSDTVYLDAERGALDIVFTFGAAPPPLRSEPLFEDSFSCLLSSEHPLAKAAKPTLDAYLDCDHVIINIAEGRQGVRRHPPRGSRPAATRERHRPLQRARSSRRSTDQPHRDAAKPAPRRSHDPGPAIRHSGASGDRPNQLLDGLASTTGQRSRPTMAPRNDPLGDLLRPNVPPSPAVSRSRRRETAIGRSRDQASLHGESTQPARRSWRQAFCHERGHESHAPDYVRHAPSGHKQPRQRHREYPREHEGGAGRRAGQETRVSPRASPTADTPTAIGPAGRALP